MKKIILSVVAIGFIVMIGYVTSKAFTVKENINELVLANIEALTGGENPLDEKVWVVYAESSTKWTCTNGGTSACPAP